MPLQLPRAVDLFLAGRRLCLGNGPALVMGIVNVTPDSFSDGGWYFDPNQAIAHAERLVAEGADWLDIGGESTRPGAEPVPVAEELRRVIPVIEALAAKVKVPLSIDTYKAETAERALEAGATVINDVNGFRDPKMIGVAAQSAAALVCMHMRGDPRTMQQLAEYNDVVGALADFFAERLTALARAGIDRRRIVIDPGIGFAKKRRHNLEILRRLDELGTFERPVLLGASRKRIVGELTGRPEGERLHGSVATAIYGYLHGAHILRVHEVAPVKDALAVVWGIESPESGAGNAGVPVGPEPSTVERTTNA